MNNQNNIKYYQVEAKCGHVGITNYIIIKFAIIANSKKEAAKIAREIPRVKHHQKDAIVSVEEISFEQYKYVLEDNQKDAYLSCANRQEQRIYCLNIEERIIREKVYDKNPKRNRQEKIKYKKKKEHSIKTADKYCLISSFA